MGGDVNLYAYVDSVGKPFSIEANLYQYAGNNPVNYIDPLGLRGHTILDWPDPFITSFQAYDFRNKMKKDFLLEYQETGNKCWKELSDNYSWINALIDMYKFDEKEALEYYKKKCWYCQFYCVNFS